MSSYNNPPGMGGGMPPGMGGGMPPGMGPGVPPGGMPPQQPPPAEPPDPEGDSDRQRRNYRKARRKVREHAGQIKELNITAMMDTMTILLVFLLKSYSASTTTVQINDYMQVPKSTTQQKPQESITVTVAYNEISVDEKKVAPVVNGLVPAGFREEETMLISPLFDELVNQVDKQKEIAKYNPKAPFTGRVNIFADRRIPYQTLLSVLYTAGKAELAQYKLAALRTEF